VVQLGVGFIVCLLNDVRIVTKLRVGRLGKHIRFPKEANKGDKHEGEKLGSGCSEAGRKMEGREK
jgi:hypothetical protein